MAEEVKETREDFEAQLEESLNKASTNEDAVWNRLEQMKEDGDVLALTVGGVVNGGVIVYVEGIRGFIPASLLSTKYVEDLNVWLQKDVEAKIITVEPEEQRLVLSAKAVEKEKERKERENKINELKVGTVVEGTVENIMPYGAFVDIGDGISGLVHISQLSQKRVKSPEEVVKEGDAVTVKIIKVANGKVSLSIKALEDDKEAAKKAEETGVEYTEDAAGTSLGDLLATWGETHGAGVGVVVDGCPAGLPLEREDVQKYLDRRKPGQSKYTTQRKEGDQVEILSGIFEGRTTGTPISMVVYNKDQRSKDYSNIKDIYRPGHADFTFDMKYGFRDYRGGGRSSGRETIGRVAAGAVAAKVLKELGIEIKAYAKAIAGIEVSKDHFDFAEMNNNPFNMPDKEAAKLVQEKADQMIKEMDSIGGIIECQITGMPVGIGETVFDKLDAELSKAIMSIGSVKGFEIGDGFEAANLRGSENNDDFICVDGKVEKETNHSGGVLGGMSDGSAIVFRAAIKPTPSIAQTQKTVNRDLDNVEIEIHGRHDPMIVPRAVVVVESMAAVTILDGVLKNLGATMDNIKKIYGE